MAWDCGNQVVDLIRNESQECRCRGQPSWSAKYNGGNGHFNVHSWRVRLELNVGVG